MEESSQGSITMIRSMVMEYIHGLMIESTEGGGKRASKMDLGYTLFMRRRMSKRLNLQPRNVSKEKIYIQLNE